MDRFTEINKAQMKDSEQIPEFAAGDTIRVAIWVREGNKERIQNFEGTVIKRRGGGLNATFTVRKISGGIGVERVFLVHSPVIESIKVIRRGRVRRAKLYYLRNLTGKATRIKERNLR